MPVFTAPRGPPSYCPICHHYYGSKSVPKSHYRSIHPEFFDWLTTYMWQKVYPSVILILVVLAFVAIDSESLLPVKFDNGILGIAGTLSFVPLLTSIALYYVNVRRFRRAWQPTHPKR